MNLLVKLVIDCEYGIAGDIRSLPNDEAVELCEIGAAVPVRQTYEREAPSYETR